jgi:hypothetical protein
VSVLIYLNKQGKSLSGVADETKTAVSPFGEILGGVSGGLFGNNKETGGNSVGTSTVSENNSKKFYLFKLSNERSPGVSFADVLVASTTLKNILVEVDATSSATGTKPKKIKVASTTLESVFATTTKVRFVEGLSGNIFEYDIASSTSKKLTNTLIPKIEEAFFLDNGNSVILRYPDKDGISIESFLASIPKSSSVDKLSGYFLPQNILGLSPGLKPSDFFYLAKTKNSGVVGNIYNTKTKEDKRVFSSDFSEWVPTYTEAGVYLNTKASDGIEGFIYLQNIVSNSFTKIAGNRNTITSLPSYTGERVLMAFGTDLYIYNKKTSSYISVGEIKTLPEKCVWIPGEENILCAAPESLGDAPILKNWYQGKTSFSDKLFLINTNSGSAISLQPVKDLSKTEPSLDIINLSISKDGKYIVFLNKKDKTPWLFFFKENIDMLLGGETDTENSIEIVTP